MTKQSNEIIPTYEINELLDIQSGKKEFEFYRFEYFATNIDHLKDPHRHDHFAIFFITAGKGMHNIDFDDYELKPNRLFFLSAGQIHTWKGNPAARGFVLLFNSSYFNMSAQSRHLRDFLYFNTLQPKPYIDIGEESKKYFVQLFINMEEEHLTNANHKHIIIRAYLTILLYELVRLYENSISVNKAKGLSVDKISEFEKAVNVNFISIKTVAEYAAMLNITPNYLNAICKKVKGKAASEIIQDRIMLEAKRLLSHSGKTVAEIAFYLGFEDNSYFGRFFKKYNGQTPVEFRSHIQAKEHR